MDVTSPFAVPFNTDTVQQLLRRLPARQRVTLRLRFGQGLTDRQVAALLGCGVSTVRTLTLRGVRRVRELLSEQRTIDLRT